MAAPRSATASAAARRDLTPREIEALRRFLAASPDSAAPAAAALRSRARPPARGPGRGARRRQARAARAARRRQLLRTGRRWSVRVVRLTVFAAAVPLALSVLVPGPSLRPVTGSADATTLALTAQSTLVQDAQTYRRLEDQVQQRQAALRRAEAAETAARAAVTARIAPAAVALYTAGPQAWYPLGPATAVPTGLAGTGQQLAALRQAERLVAAEHAAVDAVTRRADQLLADVRQKATGLGPEVTATLAGLGDVPSPAPGQARNAQVLARWQAYLQQLAAAGIDPPPAAAIADLDHLPAGLSPVLDHDGHRVPGVVRGVIGNTLVVVPPAEAVAAVSAALSQLGKPFAARATGPDAYDCGGFTAAAWLMAGYALPSTPQDQWATGAPVTAAELQVGDLVLSPGGQDVGVYLGNGDVVGASAADSRVAVRSLQPGSSGVRVTLPRPAQQNAPLPGLGEGACGAPPPAPSNPAWGGYQNGRIPAAALCRLSAPGQALRCDAAAAYEELSRAYAAVFGAPICITDSYRPYATQVTAFREKPALAAVPGTSNHGWALAVDLCGGINSAGSPQWTWMQANAPRFGFLNPPWARPGAEKPEPWHWEFGNFG